MGRLTEYISYFRDESKTGSSFMFLSVNPIIKDEKKIYRSDLKKMQKLQEEIDADPQLNFFQ